MNGSCKHTGVDVIGESIWSSTGPMEGVTDQCLGGQISTKKFLQVWQLDHVWWNRRYKGLGTMLAKSDSEYSKEISGTVELSGGPRQALQPWATRQEISQEWSPRLGLGPWDKDRTQSLMMDASYEPEANRIRAGPRCWDKFEFDVLNKGPVRSLYLSGYFAPNHSPDVN